MKEHMSYRRKGIYAILVLVMVLGACAGDPVKTSLYSVKEEFMAVMEYMVKQNLAGKVPFDQWQEYSKLDNKFTALYDSTLLIYKLKVGIDNGVLVSTNMNKLRDLLLEARQKFYPGS